MAEDTNHQHTPAQTAELERRAAYGHEHPGPLSEEELNRREQWDRAVTGAPVAASGLTPAADVVAPKPYVWMATLTAAKDATVYRRAIAEDPHAVPLRVWQFCEEHGVNVCAFDGVTARDVTELEEVLALSPPHAHAQIRADGAIFHVSPAPEPEEIAPPVTPVVEPVTVLSSAGAHVPLHTPDQESFGE